MIRNPILPGFNPDPSICRVGDDYYIATSTFEWYPGVQIHHSRDLVNWTMVRRPLERKSQLDMRGNPDSCGVWAPCLSYADGLFWLVYTDVKRFDGNFKDAHNYIVTSPTIEGEWSEPVYVNSSGFDPSLFHDEDGRKWFMNMQWNHRTESFGGAPKSPAFDGILLQEWDAATRSLKGPIKNIFAGSSLGLVEGPQQVPEVSPGLRVERRGRLVQEHHLRLVHERARDGQPLPLPAGEVLGAGPRLLRHADASEQLPLRDVRARMNAGTERGEMQVRGLVSARVLDGDHAPGLATPRRELDRAGGDRNDRGADRSFESGEALPVNQDDLAGRQRALWGHEGRKY